MVISLGFLTFLILIVSSESISSENENSTNNSGTNWVIGSIVFSVGFLVASIVLVSLCTWPICIRIRGRLRHFFCPPEIHDDIPVATNGPRLSTISYGTGSLHPRNWGNGSSFSEQRAGDSIIFEPLPTLSDLSVPPEPTAYTLRSINPLAILQYDEDEIQADTYAQDWFAADLQNFSRGNIEYLREIGKGWFGSIIEADAKNIVAYTKKLKVTIKTLRDNASTTESMQFLAENRIYRDADHPNIMRLLGHSIETSPLLIILENFPQGDLKSFLLANVNRSELLNDTGEIVRMALDVAKGLEWLAIAGFAHGDLAARNCQVASENRIVIGEYGDSVRKFREDYFFIQTSALPIRWSAPESIRIVANQVYFEKVNAEANLWSFGILLWELCEFGKRPYTELIDVDVISKVIEEKSIILPIPKNPYLTHRETLYQLMTNCWNVIPENRIRISHLVAELQDLLLVYEPDPESILV